MENEKKSVQTVLTISNTDIVTMLMVKQKKVLQDKVPGLQLVLKQIKDHYVTTVKGILDEEIKESKTVGLLKQSLDTLHKIYNVKNIPFKIDFLFSTQGMAEGLVDSAFYKMQYDGSPRNMAITVNTLPSLGAILGNAESTEEEVREFENNFHYVCDENEYEVPYHGNKHTVAITPTDKAEYEDTVKQLARIQDLLRSDVRMKEEIVAKMTEKAIDANVELQAIIGDVLLLE